MPNPFEQLAHKPTEDLEYDEWSGQFSCNEEGCLGWSNLAKYWPKQRLLAWQCQDGHVSKLENIDE